MINIEQSLPEFAGEALMPNGEFGKISLAEFRGRWVVLFFWPLDFTFVCPTEIRAFNALAPEFSKAGAVLLGASTDSVWSHKAWCNADLGKMSFPMIGDNTQALTRGCDVLHPVEGVALRATLIANPEGKVQSTLVNSLDIGRNAAETLRTLQALQTGGLTACDWQPGKPLLRAA